jgi:hypothetical protein
MALHDSYARITPFELLLPTEDFADQRFPLIRKEAEQRRVSLADPEKFVLLGEVGAVLRIIRGEDEDPRSIHQAGILLFHAYHFWSQGHSFFHVATEVVRYLVTSGPESGAWPAALPGPAGYVQFPQHLIWVPGGEDDPPESVDGFFWSSPDGENITLLVAMGLRRDRPGFGVVPLPTLPLSAAGEWAATRVRSEGEDFEATLPGAEHENLYSISAGAEAVKLAMLLFWYLDEVPGSVAESPKGTGEKGPRPSALDARRVVLTAD